MKLLVDNKIPFFREYLKKIKNYDQFIVKYFDDNNLCLLYTSDAADE